MHHITLSEFRTFPQQEQLYLLFEKGIVLARRQEGACLIRLFAHHHFYVEAYYNLKRKRFEKVKCFEGIANLEPYLRQMNLLIR